MRTEPTFSTESDDHLQPGPNDSTASKNSESQLLSDYRQRYGLSVDPFADDPHFPFYQGAQRRQILEQLLHLCQFSNNLLVVTGDYGVGKTRMAQALIDSLDDSDDICFIEGQITSDMSSLFSEILAQFELDHKEGFTELCRKKSDQDGLVVIIIDNAHHLTDEVIADLINLLEENFESRLHLVMFAEPYLLIRLNKIDAPDIVLTDFFLEKFSLVDAVDYLNFRMEMADYLGPEIFVEGKVEPWWRQSQGQLLALHDYAHEKLLESVTEPANNKTHKPFTILPHIVATSVLMGGLFLWYLYAGGESKEQPVKQVTESVPVAKLQESSAISSQVSSQSSISASATNVATTIVAVEKNSEQTYSITATSVSTSSATAEKPPASREIKQSVVPLAQTSNDFHSQVAQKSGEVSASRATITEKEKTSHVGFLSNRTLQSQNIKSTTVTESQNYNEQKRIILSWTATDFTLQLVGLSSEKAVQEYISKQPNRKELLVYKSKRQNKDWFVVLTGRYPSSLKARQAIELLPESQKKAGAWPRLVSDIQKED